MRTHPLPERDAPENPDGCLFCGKDLKEHRYAVLVSTAGVIVHPDDEALLSEEEHNGFLYVGTECRKKVPKTFIVDMEVLGERRYTGS